MVPPRGAIAVSFDSKSATGGRAVPRDGRNGLLYGTTESGGGSCNFGTIFAIDTNGKESIIYIFKEHPDGNSPSELARDAAGNLFGTTVFGGR